MQKAKQTWPGSPGPEKARSPLPRFLRSPARVVGPRGCPISASLSVLIDATEEMSVVNILFHFSGMLPSSSAIRNQVNPFPLAATSQAPGELTWLPPTAVYPRTVLRAALWVCQTRRTPRAAATWKVLNNGLHIFFASGPASYAADPTAPSPPHTRAPARTGAC